MKYIIIAIISFLSLSTNAQTNADFVGKWKVITFSDDELYFNLENDSSSLTNESVMNYPDSSDQKKFVARAKHIYSGFEFRFLNESYFEILLDTMILFKGKYEIDRSRNLIILISTDPQAEERDELAFVLTDNNLKIEMLMGETKCSLGLRREQKTVIP